MFAKTLPLSYDLIQETLSRSEAGKVVVNGLNAYEGALKKVAAAGLLLFAGSVIAKIAGFLRQFIIIRMLSPGDYGLFALGLTFFNLMPSLGLLGLYHGSQRYIAYYAAVTNNSKVKGAIRSSFLTVMISSTVFISLLAAFSNPLAMLLDKPELRNILLLFVIGIPFAMLNSLLSSFFLGFHRADIVALLNNYLFSFLSVAFTFFGLTCWKSAYSPVLAMVASAMLISFTFLYLFMRIIWRHLEAFKAARITKELLLFSLPLFFSGVSYIILNNTDTLMLGYYMTSEAVGYYNAAFLLMQSLAIFLGSFSVIFMPVLTSLVAKAFRKEARELYQVVTKWISVLTAPAILTLFLFPRQVLTTLFSPAYGQAEKALGILVAAEFVHTTLGPNEQALIAHGASKSVFTGYATAAVLNIVLNALLIPRMGITGAAVATGISLMVLNIFFSTELFIRFKVHPFGWKLLLPLTLCSASAAALYIPLKASVNSFGWLAFLCYPFFLILDIFFIIITRSYSKEDIVVLKAIKSRLINIRN